MVREIAGLANVARLASADLPRYGDLLFSRSAFGRSVRRLSEFHHAAYAKLLRNFLAESSISDGGLIRRETTGIGGMARG